MSSSGSASSGGVARLGAWHFIMVFGVVGMLMDVVYEGARSITGPLLAFTAAPASAVTGILLWGAALGIQESTLRATVADLVPSGAGRLRTGSTRPSSGAPLS